VAEPPSDGPEKGTLIPPPKRAGLRARAPRPSGGGAGAAEPRAPANMVCQRCGAEFAWDRADRPGGTVEWSARLVKGSQRCDCGYGQRSSGRPGPHP
jgi:hypothetical protein